MTQGLGMGGHQSTRMGKDEWLTPPHIIKALGVFDLDPCAPINRPWDTARNHYTVLDDGLSQPWEGRVWLNPPYGREAEKWLARISKHQNGIALIFARTETRSFNQHVWPTMSAALFLDKRIAFYHVDGKSAAHNGGAPSVLVAYGHNNAVALRHSGLRGAFVTGVEMVP